MKTSGKMKKNEKKFNQWVTQGHNTMHQQQLLDEGCNYQALFIQSKLHTWHHKKYYKIPMCSDATNKTMPSGNTK